MLLDGMSESVELRTLFLAAAQGGRDASPWQQQRAGIGWADVTWLSYETSRARSLRLCVLGTVGYIVQIGDGISVLHGCAHRQFPERQHRSAAHLNSSPNASILINEEVPLYRDTTCGVLYVCIVLVAGAWTAIQLQSSRHRSQWCLHAVRGDDVVTSYFVQLLQELGAGDSIMPCELLPATPL